MAPKRAAALLAAILVAVLLVPQAAAAAMFESDDFSAGLDASRWSVVDPLGGASVGVADERLRIDVPGGARHNPGAPNEAPRALQEIADDDLDLVARFDSVPSQAFQMQGWLVEESASRFVRLEVHHDGQSLRAFGATVVDGALTPRIDVEIPSPAASLWLRVVRTGDAWTLRYSFDGLCWSDAGTFSHPLAVTRAGVFAGNWHASPALTPAFTATVHHVENQAAPLDGDPPDPGPPAGPFVPDDFTGGLDPARWSTVDPLGGSSVAVVEASLRIEVPGGQPHEPWVCNNAPRVLQRVEDGDLDIAARFDSLPTQVAQMQGLIVEETASRYLRFDVHHDGSSLRAYAASVVDGTATERINTVVPGMTQPVWLRVVRDEGTWTFRYSSDGRAWTDAGEFAQPLTVTAAGVFAGNWHSSAAMTPAYTAVVAQVESGAAPPSPLTVEVVTPRQDDVVFGDAQVGATVTGDGPVDRVELSVDGQAIGTVTSEPYELSWDTTTAGDGERVVEARAFGPGGAEASASVSVTVANELDGAQRVQADFEQGLLDVDDHARYGIWSISGDERLPARYAAAEVDEHTTTGWGLVFASNWEQLTPETLVELQEYFEITEEPQEGMAAAESGFPDCDLGVTLWAMMSTYHCRTVTGPFTIVYDLESHDASRGVPEIDLLGADLEFGPNGVPDDVDRIAFGAVQSLAHYVDDLGYEHPGAEVTIVVWDEGKGGFAPPPQFAGAGFYVANRHPTPQYLVSHEVFHTVQNRYVGLGALRAPLRTWWWMEATAEWAAHQAEWHEDGWPGEARGQYASALPRFLGRPAERLYRFNNPRGGEARQYGAFVFAEYLDMVAGRDAIRGTWERLGSDPDDAIRAEMQSHDLDLAEELPRFARANYFLDYSNAPRLVATDLQAWRTRLADDPRTTGDLLWATPRPARHHQSDLTSGEPQSGHLHVEPGGAAYLEFRPPRSGELAVDVGASRPDTHVRAVGVPSGCGVDAVVLPRGSTGAEVDVPLPHACDLVTLIVTHTKPDSSFITDVDWEVTFTPTRGIVEHGDVQLGVHWHGRLAIPGGPPSSGLGNTIVGLRYLPTNAEGIAGNHPYDGWGVYDIVSGTGGWASAGNYPQASGLLELGFTTASDRATSVVGAADGRLQVTHDFKPSPATDNLFELEVTIRHVGSPLDHTGSPVDLRYRRVLNWAVEPTPFDEYATIKTTSISIPPELEFTSNDGYGHPGGYDFKSDRGATGFFTDYGPTDQGALFDWDFGMLSSGGSITFTLFYGAAGTEQEALDAIDAVGAHVYALGKPSGPGGKSQGMPNTFIFAYRSPESE